MRRSQNRRSQNWLSGRRRLVAAVATLVAFGGIITVTQVSNASTRADNRALASCDSVKAPSANQAKLSTETRRGTYKDRNNVTQHADDGTEVPTTAQLRQACRNNVLATKAGKGKGNRNGGNNNGGGGNNNGGNNNANGGNNNGADTSQLRGGANAPGAALGVLANSCDGSKLGKHDGFQKGSKCVSTEFGEVGEENRNPQLLIVSAPAQVAVGAGFQLKVSTRNLQRDRFLGAAAGGYYVESSVLANGTQRGHFHTACRLLASLNEAPPSDPVPEFFVATEDKKGGNQPDVVTIEVAGMPKAGVAQCSSWAGDGSHRIPMMVRANQTPAFDTVKVKVGNGGGNGGGGNGNGGGRGNNNNGNGGNNAQTNAGGAQARPKALNCPSVAGKLGQIPAAAQNEVMRNLALLETQIRESQQRLLSSANEGGPAFVVNAVVGPLNGKRASTLDRIRLAIERAGGKAPAGLAGLANCTAV